MKRELQTVLLFRLGLLAWAGLTWPLIAEGEVADKPNFLVILADDLGYSDLGVYGGEIATPNLDALARRGVMLTNFHAAAACSPTRAMLMTGVDHHLVGTGAMVEHMAANQRGQPGYEGFLNDRAPTIAEQLRQSGYRTYMAGKWHLGRTEETSPAARGFDRSYVLLTGGAGHFDQTGLGANDHPASYREDGKLVQLPADFGHSTDFYTRQVLRYIDEGRKSGQPFFAYVAYTAPHWPLQAYPEDIAKYRGMYDAGWQKVRAARVERLRARGLLAADAPVRDIVADSTDWNSLSAAEQQLEARRMEVYAAMVDHLDRSIGSLLAHLEASGDLRNTVVIFLSDNGPEGARLDRLPAMAKWISRFDNSIGLMGSKNSYVMYLDRWAQVSSTPGALHKGMPTEGGIQVPAIVSYPGVVRPGTRSDALLSVLDIAPTLLDLAGASVAPNAALQMQGRSMVSLLQGDSDAVRSPNDGLGWELFNKLGYRQAQWKTVKIEAPWGTGAWQLFDLSKDPGETRDIASGHPAVLRDLVSRWGEYARTNGVVLSTTPAER